MATLRRNQATLTQHEWTALVNAITAMHGIGTQPPAYRDFVRVHVDAMSPVGMAWGVHTMPGMGMVGRNFLAWHRQFLLQLEHRLQLADPTVALPYWDWIADRQLPPALNKPALLASWGVSRSWDAAQLPTQAELDAVSAQTTFRVFQRRLEQLHNDVHNAVGGTMDSASSPADPLFFLHHANIDRLWAQWQQAHPSARPRNTTEALQPPPLFGNKVSSVLALAKLGYSYA